MELFPVQTNRDIFETAIFFFPKSALCPIGGNQWIRSPKTIFLQPLSIATSRGLLNHVHTNPGKKDTRFQKCPVSCEQDLKMAPLKFHWAKIITEMPSLDLCSIWHASEKSNCTFAWPVSNAGIFVSSFWPRGSPSGCHKRYAFVTPVSADPNDCSWVSEDVTRANERELNR